MLEPMANGHPWIALGSLVFSKLANIIWPIFLSGMFCQMNYLLRLLKGRLPSRALAPIAD